MNLSSPNWSRGSENSQMNNFNVPVSATLPSSLLGLNFEFVNDFDDFDWAALASVRYAMIAISVPELKRQDSQEKSTSSTCRLTCTAVFNKLARI